MNYACINSRKGKRGPLFGPCSSIGSGHALWAEELKYLREGRGPRDNNDRWTVSLDNGTLRHWRSRATTYIYEIQVVVGEYGHDTVVGESVVGN